MIRRPFQTAFHVLSTAVAFLFVFALPAQAQDHDVVVEESGYATWTNLQRHGKKTASGERYDHKAMTAAHSSLPFDTMVRVVNPYTEKSVVVRINDRPDQDVMIDLSGAAARELGMFSDGFVEVVIAPLESDAFIAFDGTEEAADDAAIEVDEPTVRLA